MQESTSKVEDEEDDHLHYERIRQRNYITLSRKCLAKLKVKKNMDRTTAHTILLLSNAYIRRK